LFDVLNLQFLSQLTSALFLAATSRHILYTSPTPICCLFLGSYISCLFCFVGRSSNKFCRTVYRHLYVFDTPIFIGLSQSLVFTVGWQCDHAFEIPRR